MNHECPICHHDSPDGETHTACITTILNRIPDLAAEVWATRDHPNPSGNTGHTRPVFASKPPTSLAWIDAIGWPVVGDQPAHGCLHDLCDCTRTAWTAIRQQPNPADLPPVAEQPTYTSECAWLARTAPAWQPIRPDGPWIVDTIRKVHHTLAALAREPQPTIYVCPVCGADMREQPGGQWLLCDAGHQQPGRNVIIAKYLRAAPMPPAIIESELHIPAATLRSWRARGKITPAHIDGRIAYFLPADVLALAYPDLADVLRSA